MEPEAVEAVVQAAVTKATESKLPAIIAQVWESVVEKENPGRGKSNEDTKIILYLSRIGMKRALTSEQYISERPVTPRK